MTNLINGNTQVCGILGYPVGHSYSPAMHNAAFAALGLNFAYLPFAAEPQRLPSAAAGIRALGLTGVNVTIPHKQEIMPLLDEISEEARLIGAVNTIVNNEGRLFGDNTDGKGFLRALQEQAGYVPDGKTALILGAGGAARAVAVSLALSGAGEIFLTNRSQGRAEELAALLRKHCGSNVRVLPWPDGREQLRLPRSDLTVQTTPVGMGSSSEPAALLPLAPWGPGQIVCDLIYNPAETEFMKRAHDTGAVVMNGLEMLLYQGALSFQLWTGKTAPIKVMRDSLLESMRQRC